NSLNHIAHSFLTHARSIAYVLGKEFVRSVIGEPDRPGSSAPVKLRGSLCDEQRWYIIRPQSHCGLQVGLASVRVQTTDSQPRELSNGMKGPSIFVCKACIVATRVPVFVAHALPLRTRSGRACRVETRLDASSSRPVCGAPRHIYSSDPWKPTCPTRCSLIKFALPASPKGAPATMMTL